jgi:predicted acyl esterase
MRSSLLVSLLTVAALPAQTGAQTASQIDAQRAAVAAIRENYTKFEYQVPVRDGVKLFTSVYVPKDVFSDGKTYPILLRADRL